MLPLPLNSDASYFLEGQLGEMSVADEATTLICLFLKENTPTCFTVPSLLAFMAIECTRLREESTAPTPHWELLLCLLHFQLYYSVFMVWKVR